MLPNPYLALAVAAMLQARRKRKPWRIERYPYHFDMPPSPNESRQVRRARQRKGGK